MTSPEEYLGKVIAVLHKASEYVSPEGMSESKRLVEHGEPADGMCSLAWAIVNEGASVPAWLILHIRALADDLVDESEFPPGFTSLGHP